MGSRSPGIALIGLRRAGKTSVGRELATVTGLPFADLDEAIESKFGHSVGDILLEQGEAAFRRVESEVLGDVVVRGPAVLACGGGTPTLPENRARLHEFGTTLYLHVTTAELEMRLRGDVDHASRPPLLDDVDPIEEIRRLYEDRDPLYRQSANAIIEADDDVETVVAHCLYALRNV